MSDTISRRSLGRAALSLGLLPTTTLAARPQGDAVQALDKELAKPLEGTPRELAPPALKAVGDAAQARRKHPLPEGSEPCTRYHSAPKETR